jgi:MFS family permease
MLPWATHIVPEEKRGEFLARDQAAIAFSGIVALFLYGLFLRGEHAWYSYGAVFAAGGASAFVSLVFMKRIPDVPVEKIAVNPHPMPWREMLFYPPFFHYLRYNLVVNLALGTSGVFWVRYFRAFLHVSESNTLLMACCSNSVLAVTLLLVTRLLDRTGNKPVLIVSSLFLIVHFTGWACVAAGVLPFTYPVILLQIFTSGIGGALWNVGNLRAVMNIIPAMGRPHFLALYSVISSLTIAIMPLLWGPVLDALDTWHAAWRFWNWNSYSVLYCTLAATMAAGLVMLRTVVEPVQMTWDVFVRELLIFTPSRAVTRLIGRLRSIGIG